VKIAYIAASVIPSWTANSVQVMKVCQALTQNGEEVCLFVPGKIVSNWETLSAHYGVTTCFPIRWVGFVPAIKKVDFVLSSLLKARRWKADLVYTRLLWAAVIAKDMGFPVILEIHDRPIGHMGARLLRNLVRSKGRKKIVLITHALKTILESEYQLEFKADDLIIAPDGVDLERYVKKYSPAQARKLLGLEEKITAVYSGGFYGGRGLEVLIDLAKHFPEVQFLWVGGKEDIVIHWKTIIDQAQITNIQLTGFVENKLLPLYQMAADVLLMPYGKMIAGSSGGNIADVSSPMKMFEYMASGRVILTSDLPVLREVLNDSNAVFYFPEDLIDLIDKFADLIKDESTRKRIADQALQDVSQYSWQERMKRIIQSLGSTYGS
jgi:glycosyltransferase involved in cell wall biosynthesis